MLTDKAWRLFDGRADALGQKLVLNDVPYTFGERHRVIVKRESTGQPNIQWREFEERPGPKPTDDALTICLRGEPAGGE